MSIKQVPNGNNSYYRVLLVHFLRKACLCSFQAMHDAHPVDQITKACFEPNNQVLHLFMALNRGRHGHVVELFIMQAEGHVFETLVLQEPVWAWYVFGAFMLDRKCLAAVKLP